MNIKHGLASKKTTPVREHSIGKRISLEASKLGASKSRRCSIAQQTLGPVSRRESICKDAFLFTCFLSRQECRFDSKDRSGNTMDSRYQCYLLFVHPRYQECRRSSV